MKQILQNLRTGTTEIMEVPLPAPGRGQVLIHSTHTLVSAGTERMLVDFGKAGWLEKARQQPEKVKQVLEKIRTDGVLPTVAAVLNKLDEPIPLGYCNAGICLEVGPGVTDFKPGDRIASNGAHAEIICVPRNLCARIPEGVSNEEAAFTVLGAIALQGVRLAAPTLGERFAVFGLGLVGLLTVQLLRASGCSVLAVDVSTKRLGLAKSFGAEIVDAGKGMDPVAAAQSWSGGKGVDGAIIAASAKDDDILHESAQACRKRGRIVLIGVVDLNMRRGDFYEKELTFQVSCSYGPGRYDQNYEREGHDYPFGYVRWTEQRNFEAVLGSMQTKQLQVQDLITHRFSLEEAPHVYEKVLHDADALGALIHYPEHGGERVAAVSASPHFHVSRASYKREEKRVVAGVIGAGNFARSTLLPALVRTNAGLAAIADINGVAASHAVRKFGMAKAVSDYKEILDNPEINTVFIVVAHHLHARFACEALEAGKHVFVEKPLAITETQLAEVVQVYERITSPLLLMVGFNRRFSPHIKKVKELLESRTGPLCMVMTVNAGYIPPEHWVQNPEVGGGRIVGEACHFIDLLCFLADAPVISVSAAMIESKDPVSEDKMSIGLKLADGSLGIVNYFANGSKSYPKEILEVFGDGKVIRMENFRLTRGYGFKAFRSFRTWRQDKGHRAEIAAFVDCVSSGGPPLIPIHQLENVTRASLAAREAAISQAIIKIRT